MKAEKKPKELDPYKEDQDGQVDLQGVPMEEVEDMEDWSGLQQSSWQNILASLDADVEAVMKEAGYIDSQGDLKYNPHHDRIGRFTNVQGAVSRVPSQPNVQKPVAPATPSPAPVQKPVQKEPDGLAGLKPAGKYKKMEGEYDTWIKQLAPDEKAAVVNYTTPEYASYNGFLRNGKPKATSALKKKITALDAALDKGSAPFPFTVSRGMGFRDPAEYKKFVDGLKTNLGKTFSDKGYGSTSVDSDAFVGNVQYKIHVPKGAKGGYVDKISDAHPPEREFLLPRGTTYKVRKMSTSQDNGKEVTNVELEIVPAGKSVSLDNVEEKAQREVSPKFLWTVDDIQWNT